VDEGGQEKSPGSEVEADTGKELNEKTASIEKMPDVKELLEYMDGDPLVYYEMMAHFQKLKRGIKDFMETTADQDQSG